MLGFEPVAAGWEVSSHCALPAKLTNLLFIVAHLTHFVPGSIAQCSDIITFTLCVEMCLSMDVKETIKERKELSEIGKQQELNILPTDLCSNRCPTIPI